MPDIFPFTIKMGVHNIDLHEILYNSKSTIMLATPNSLFTRTAIDLTL